VTWTAFFGVMTATLISTVFGYVISVALLPAQFRSRFAWAFAPGVGLGFCSLIFFVFRRPMRTVEFALLILISVVWLRRQTRANFSRLFALSWRPPVLALVAANALGLAIVGLVLRVERMPHGNVDGWAIWNTHARLLYRLGSDWKTLLPYTFHGDYPLLTPAVAARFWRYAHEEIPEAGALLGIIAFLSSVALLALTLRELRDGALAVLCSSPVKTLEVFTAFRSLLCGLVRPTTRHRLFQADYCSSK
jgi:hypothetical protein